MYKAGRIFITTIVFTVACLICNAQPTRIDSLKTNIYHTANTAAKLKAVIAFCDEWDSYNPDTLYSYLLLAKKMAAEQKDDRAMLLTDYYKAVYLLQKNRVDTALAVINDVISRAKKTMPYSYTYAKFWMLRGNILQRTSHYDKVLKQDYEMLGQAEQNNDTIAIIRFNTGIGNVNTRLKKFDEALKWHHKATALMQTDKLKAECSFVYINIAVVFYHLATLNDNKQNEDSIEINLQNAIQYARQGNSLTNLANGLSMYGNTLAEYKKLQPAEKALTEAIETRKRIGDVFYEISDLIALSSFYENSNNNEKAIETCLQALKLANDNGPDFSSMISVYSSLGELYENAGDYKNYSKVLEKRMSILDSVYKVNSARAISELEEQYDVQKKENTIINQKYQLANERNYIYIIAGAFLLLFVIVAAVLRNRKIKQQLKIDQLIMENEKVTMLAVENAKEEERMRIIADLHDEVGGGLSTIRMVSDLIAEQKEQSLQLEQYASKISGITKDVTQRMNMIVWALNTENDTLQNLSEYIREYGYSFFENSSIAFKSSLPNYAAPIQLSGLQRKDLFLCVKEALNNAYKHSGAKNVQVVTSYANNILSIQIQDDGQGIINENSFGNGLKNMKKRMSEIKGAIAVENKGGTTISLDVYIKRNPGQ